MQKELSNIFNRRSVRTFSPKAIETEKKTELMNYADLVNTGPFGNQIHIHLIELSETDLKDIKSLGTYGMIRGATTYLAGSIKPADTDMEDFGYCMEKVILKATELGLGTCWLGGTLNRANFADRIGIQENEIIPAATPLGYALETPRFWEKTVRVMIGANNRKPSSTLFFTDNATDPLIEDSQSPYSQALEAVRAAPSASNKQPWRLVKSGGEYHFYLDEDKVYNSVFKNIKIQNLDMGIAMAHFETALNSLGIRGSWIKGAPPLKNRDWVAIASWKEIN